MRRFSLLVVLLIAMWAFTQPAIALQTDQDTGNVIEAVTKDTAKNPEISDAVILFARSYEVGYEATALPGNVPVLTHQTKRIRQTAKQKHRIDKRRQLRRYVQFRFVAAVQRE